MKNKYHFVFDKTKNNNKLVNLLLKNYKNYPVHLSKIIIVLGGDGFMLHAIKKYQRYNKSFFGINIGTYGFLMNKLKKNYDLDKIIFRSKLFSISPLQMDVKTKHNKKFSAIAINEVSFLRQTRQTASLQIRNKKKIIIKKLICDGVIVSTPAGSTAYNLSVSGPILSLNSKKLAITPISPFRPRRWKGKIIPLSSIIEIRNLNIQKRSVSVVADNYEVRNIKNVKIKINNKIKFKLLYNRNYSLSKKIQLEKNRNK